MSNTPTSVPANVLAYRVRAVLDRHAPQIAARLTIRSAGSLLILRGPVANDYQRRLVETLSRHVPEVRSVLNEIRVVENLPPITEAPLRRVHPALVGLLILLTTGAAAVAIGRPDKGEDHGPLFAIEGRVALGELAADGAFVALHPLDEHQAARPRGRTDKQGKFKLGSYGEQDGAPPGKYRVTVEWPRPQGSGDNLKFVNALPPAYASPVATPLRTEVVEGTNLPLNLKIAGAASPSAPPVAPPSPPGAAASYSSAHQVPVLSE